MSLSFIIGPQLHHKIDINLPVSQKSSKSPNLIETPHEIDLWKREPAPQFYSRPERRNNYKINLGGSITKLWGHGKMWCQVRWRQVDCQKKRKQRREVNQFLVRQQSKRKDKTPPLADMATSLFAILELSKKENPTILDSYSLTWD